LQERREAFKSGEEDAFSSKCLLLGRGRRERREARALEEVSKPYFHFRQKESSTRRKKGIRNNNNLGEMFSLLPILSLTGGERESSASRRGRRSSSLRMCSPRSIGRNQKRRR